MLIRDICCEGTLIFFQFGWHDIFNNLTVMEQTTSYSFIVFILYRKGWIKVLQSRVKCLSRHIVIMLYQNQHANDGFNGSEIMQEKWKTWKTTKKIGRHRTTNNIGWRWYFESKANGSRVECCTTNNSRLFERYGEDSKVWKMRAPWIAWKTNGKPIKKTCEILLKNTKEN